MALTFTTFDVFTKTPFRGNPLGIVSVPADAQQLTQDQKQLIARELNLSETVFLHEQTPADIRARTARIDIFTPRAEVPFAGHPTVGTANYLLHHLRLGSAKILGTRAGPVPFFSQADGAQVAVAHNFHMHKAAVRGHPVVSIVKGMTAVMARVPDLDALRAQTANLVGAENTFAAAAAALLDEGWRSGPVVTYFYVDMGRAADGTTTTTRKLRARNLGSREDPATGSSAAGLCAMLSLLEDGGEGDSTGSATRSFEITQGVEMGRPSEIRVRVTLNAARDGIEEVLISGDAVKVLEGTVPIPSPETTVKPE
ncbi:Diaminopimelate epimerase-like protein [Daldinia vernicosa]|uniref:Diaminopimelate epimerase-like protein n=1 Tax=Daldinia vernicosa TaxID=114800 RepID=UPI002007D257|nr:Diaminopimelate epimerase-like protein [Daldinia vernicosa]KAI0851978.1 Diaminopimelate epimerase-like protein [Daldinia vernicosa]